jgi:sugar lactone lactonase YvrE
MPHCVEYDSKSSTLYIADTYNHRIMRYLLNNSSRTVVAGGNGQGITTTQLYYPHAFVYDSLSKSLLIANYGANNIVRWILGANSWTLVAGSNAGTSGTTSTLLYGPTDVMLDPMGNMYVADRTNHRIQFFPFGQSNATTIAGITGISGNNSTMLYYPNSITLDNQLNLYVLDHYNDRVQKFLRY